MFKTIIFDYGATIDTPGVHWAVVLWKAYEERGVPVAEDRFREAYVYAERYLGSHDVISAEDSFENVLAKKLSLQMSWLVGEKLLSQKDAERYSKDIKDKVYAATKQHVLQSKNVLKELKEKGYSLGLVSNFYGNIKAVLKEFEIAELFETIVESATEGIRKPDPALYNLAITRMKAQPESTLVVGDSIKKDIIPAHSLHCKTAWIKGEGWCKDAETAENVADITIQDLKELLLI